MIYNPERFPASRASPPEAPPGFASNQHSAWYRDLFPPAVAAGILEPMASGGYPWTVIRIEEREEYLSALEAASVEQAIEPFAAFIEGAVKRAGGEYE